MIDIASSELRIAVGVLAIAVLVIVAKLFRTKPKRAEKWERAEIMKQLLALSEREAKAATAQSARAQVSVPSRGMRPTSVKATTKTSLPVHSKVR